MRGRKVGTIFIIVLIVLSAAQIAIDHITEYSRETGAYTEKKELYIFIEIQDKRLYVIEDNKVIREYPISSGKKDSPSPIGYWKVVEKGDWGEGFGGRWLGLNVPWGKYGIHGTIFQGSIGTASSHGCIRMYNRDVKELYNMIPHGTPVVIVNGCFGPFGTGFKELSPGDRGADVYAIQKRLKDLGFFKGWVSGIYDDAMKSAVHRFQKASGLRVQNTITKECWLAMGFREFE